MNDLTQELHQLAAELGSAGLTATVYPGEVLGMTTRYGGCALVGPWETVQLGFGSATLELTVPVQLVTAGPYDADAVERLDAGLLLALPVLQPLEPVTRGTWDAADTDMPAVTVTTRRRIPYPTQTP